VTPRASRALNAVCPYFTMFPLDFPLGVLAPHARRGDVVLDPFCGRGTTNYAARVLGLPTIGVDSSRVAVSLTEAKLANTTPMAILACASQILREAPAPVAVPQGEFWQHAYHPKVLRALCQIREALLVRCNTAPRKALRAILMGALHGPQTKSTPSHLSNQCPRTYAPKPRYAVAFWKSRGLVPQEVDVTAVIQRRAERYYSGQRTAHGFVIPGDSRRASTFRRVEPRHVRWVVTSPPYFGLRTYIPDQWLRHWFVGGRSEVDYSNAGQLAHGSPASFAEQLRTVWSNVAAVTTPDARMVVRFGGITDRGADPREILRTSFQESPWKLTTVRSAGSAESGRRQAVHFGTTRNTPRLEYDAWAQLH
jgi:hypothetical protein